MFVWSQEELTSFRTAIKDPAVVNDRVVTAHTQTPGRIQKVDPLMVVPLKYPKVA